MRLLECRDDGSFAFTPFLSDDKVPKYAVLSHTWSVNEEVTYDDMRKGTAKSKTNGYKKLLFCAKQAGKDGLRFFWLDTCCIDKRNNTELQETMISMYQWYSEATCCYVYLADVSLTEPEIEDSVSPPLWETAFRGSRWFTRGWTLQELLAPRHVTFYSAEGTKLGDKQSLQQCIHEVTGISLDALCGKDLASFSVAERLSWARLRYTSRKEDKAYSLLGIFGISMNIRYGEADQAYTRLLQKLEKNLDHLMEKLPTAPSAAFDSREDAAICLPETRQELLQEIEEWVDGPEDRCIFWLSGIAGTGKSTIARTIAKRYRERGQLGGSFFFSKGGGDPNHADRLFTTLASQLAHAIPSARQHICEAINEHKHIAQRPLREQWDQLILRPLKKLDSDKCPSAIVMVVDALDECNNRERDIRIVLKAFRSTTALSNIRLRILITSRPDNPIRLGFQQIPNTERRDFVLQGVSQQLVDRDLTLFFRHEFSTIREERDLSPDWPGDRNISRLVDRSCGLFIWAATACRYISDGKHLAAKRVSKLIRGHRTDLGPEKQLDEIYVSVLAESLPPKYDEEEKEYLRKTVREVLGTIVTISSPLSVEALANLLDIEAKSVTERLSDLHSILIVPAESDRPIRLHHPTFCDFLLDRARCGNTGFWIDKKAAHKALAKNCVSLMAKRLRRDICNLQHPGTLLGNVHPALIDQFLPTELQYACLHWAEHCRRSEMDLQDEGLVHRFLQKHFLHWLEALSLMGSSSEMAAIIRMYHSLLPPEENQHQIAFMKAARRFILAFQPTIESKPLQIYCTALVFSRPSNTLRHQFRGQMNPRLKTARIAEASGSKVKDEFPSPNDLAFTPDSFEVASGSIDERIRIWDVTTKATLSQHRHHQDQVTSVTISRDGSLLASGSDDTTITIMDMRSGALCLRLLGHSRWVNAVTFSPDDKLLASGSMDETVRVWDVASGEQLKVLDTIGTRVNAIAFSPDGLVIAVGTDDQMIRLWDFSEGDSGEIRTILDGHLGPVNSVHFSPDGQQLLSGSDDKSIRLWNIAAGTETRRLERHLKSVWSVTLSPDAKVIASGSADMTVKLWDFDTGDLLDTFDGHTSGVNAVRYSPNGRLLASSSFNDEVRLWDANHMTACGKLADFPDDATAFVRSGKCSISPEAIKGHSEAITCLTFSPDGQFVASGSNDATLKLWTRDGSPVRTLEGHAKCIKHLAFSPWSHRIASASVDGTAKVWDSASGKLLHSLDGHAGPVHLVRFSPDGRLLASCSHDKTIRLWDLSTGAALGKIEGHHKPVNDVTFSLDNQLIASCSADFTVCLWDVPSATQVLSPIKGHVDSVNSVAFSPNGEVLASGSADKSIIIWNTKGELDSTLKGHVAAVNSVAFSPDTKRVVSCSDDRTVRIWCLETQSDLAVLQVNTTVRSVSFSLCGRYINTDRGVLDAGTSASTSSSFLRRACKLFVNEEWVRHEREDVLWLPEEYRATTVATSQETAVLGHESGAISFIGF